MKTKTKKKTTKPLIMHALLITDVDFEATAISGSRDSVYDAMQSALENGAGAAWLMGPGGDWIAGFRRDGSVLTEAPKPPDDDDEECTCEEVREIAGLGILVGEAEAFVAQCRKAANDADDALHLAEIKRDEMRRALEDACSEFAHPSKEGN